MARVGRFRMFTTALVLHKRIQTLKQNMWEIKQPVIKLSNLSVTSMTRANFFTKN